METTPTGPYPPATSLSCGEEAIKPQTWNFMVNVPWYKTVTSYNHYYIATGILVNLTKPPRGEITTGHRICVSLWVRTAQKLFSAVNFYFLTSIILFKRKPTAARWLSPHLADSESSPPVSNTACLRRTSTALYSLPLPSSVPHQITFTLWKTELNSAFYITVGSTAPSG